MPTGPFLPATMVPSGTPQMTPESAVVLQQWMQEVAAQFSNMAIKNQVMQNLQQSMAQAQEGCPMPPLSQLSGAAAGPNPGNTDFLYNALFSGDGAPMMVEQQLPQPVQQPRTQPKQQAHPK